MQSRAKLLGHPVHQMLIPIPAGLFIVAVLLDIVDVFVDAAWIPTVTFWNIVIGIAGGLIAAIFGLIDWLHIPAATRAKRIGAFHAVGNVLALTFLSVAVLLRGGERVAESWSPLVLEVMALALLGTAAWLGGELVDRLGVGVDDGAHLNAPSSLRAKQVDPLRH